MEICEWCNGPLDPQWNRDDPWHLECVVEQTGNIGKNIKDRIMYLEHISRQKQKEIDALKEQMTILLRKNGKG